LASVLGAFASNRHLGISVDLGSPLGLLRSLSLCLSLLALFLLGLGFAFFCSSRLLFKAHLLGHLCLLRGLLLSGPSILRQPLGLLRLG
jgi:hypothetical protein